MLISTLRKLGSQKSNPSQEYSRHRFRLGRVKCTQSEVYAEKLKLAEKSSDAVSALTALVEAQALNVELAPSVAEAGARAICGLSASKAWKVIQQYVILKGESPCLKQTVPALVRGLVAENDQLSFNDVVDSLEAHLLRASGVSEVENEVTVKYSLIDNREAMRCLNLMLRQQAKFDVDAAVEKANRYYKLGIIIEGGTYSQLAASSLTAGNFAQAEEMLEMRDYL